MGDVFDKLTEEERDRLIGAFERLHMAVGTFFETIPFRHPRLIERALVPRFAAALGEVLADDEDERTETTEDEFEDAQAILNALAECVHGARALKNVLGTGGPELKVLMGGKSSPESA